MRERDDLRRHVLTLRAAHEVPKPVRVDGKVTDKLRAELESTMSTLGKYEQRVKLQEDELKTLRDADASQKVCTRTRTHTHTRARARMT